VCREADGYQPHLVSPEFGLRRLVQDAMDLIMEPTTTAVRRVHLLLVEAARREAYPLHPAVCIPMLTSSLQHLVQTLLMTEACQKGSCLDFHPLGRLSPAGQFVGCLDV